MRVKEVWLQGYEVEADSPDEAKEILDHYVYRPHESSDKIELIEDDFDFDQILESDEWPVTEKV